MRAFLFLFLFATAAAAQPVQCVSDGLTPVHTQILYDSPLKLVRVAKPSLKGMRRARIGDIAIHWRHQTGEREERVLNLIAERGGGWYQLRDGIGLPLTGSVHAVRAEAEAPPIIAQARGGEPLVRVTWTSHWMGANSSGLARTTVILDFRDRPRVRVSIDCRDAWGGGACTAPDLAHSARDELRCDADLRCTMNESVWLDWTTRTATRRFDLLTNRGVPSSRFDAVTYANGAAFAAAAPESIRQRALIDGIGIVQPVHRIAPGVVLFAAHATEPIAGLRFFLLDHRAWREIPLTLLTDERYPGDARDRAKPISRGFTPDGPQLQLNAIDLGIPGKRKLIEVMATEGEAHSISWIMIEPDGRAGALRVVTDQPEWRHCGNMVYPITVYSLCIPDSGLPAFAGAIASWHRWDGEDHQLPKTCALTGTIDWHPRRGWIVRLAQAPCTDPIPRPFAATIAPDGELGLQPVEFSQ